MGNVSVVNQRKQTELSSFQISKLTFDFHTFFDLNHDGFLSYKDFQWAKDKICLMSGWKIDSIKYKRTEKLFNHIWVSLLEVGDSDQDGKITITEWLALWTRYKKELCVKEKEGENYLEQIINVNTPDFRKLKEDGQKLGDESFEIEDFIQDASERVVEEMDTILPHWLHEYLVFRFDMLDRTGDGLIDTEEYEYVLSEFGIKEKDARRAFMLFTENSNRLLSFPRFVELFEEYYLSDNPADLGTFINGVLEFRFPDEVDEEVEQEDLLLQYEAMKEDDLMEDPKPSPPSKKEEAKEEKLTEDDQDHTSCSELYCQIM